MSAASCSFSGDVWSALSSIETRWEPRAGGVRNLVDLVDSDSVVGILLKLMKLPK